MDVDQNIKFSKNVISKKRHYMWKRVKLEIQVTVGKNIPTYQTTYDLANWHKVEEKIVCIEMAERDDHKEQGHGEMNETKWQPRGAAAVNACCNSNVAGKKWHT